jgi:hypothetical protein
MAKMQCPKHEVPRINICDVIFLTMNGQFPSSYDHPEPLVYHHTSWETHNYLKGGTLIKYIDSFPTH